MEVYFKSVRLRRVKYNTRLGIYRAANFYVLAVTHCESHLHEAEDGSHNLLIDNKNLDSTMAYIQLRYQSFPDVM